MTIQTEMKIFYIVFFFTLFCFSPSSYSQKKHVIHGTITDAVSGEQLFSAIVFDGLSKQGTGSNPYGFYSITLPEGKVSLKYQYVGYEPINIEFFLGQDTLLNVGLKSGIELQEVTVVASKNEKIDRSTRMSTIEVPIEQIKKLPVLLGESDVMKALQLLPGVSAGTEGTSGIYVRGGSPDQNLILLDGVPVYNVSHIGGIFSTFNSDALKNVTLTKGGFPARFGGRLSSVLEINMKEGNLNQFHGEGGVGFISSRLSLEGPIVKDKASFMISGRRTYLDLISKPFITATDANISDFRMYFYDLNAKINWKINKKHRIYLSNYLGSDVFGFGYKETFSDFSSSVSSGIDWGNITSALRWNYAIRNNLFSNTSFTYSRFRFNLNSEFQEKDQSSTFGFGARYFSGIEDYALKSDFDYSLNPNHSIKFGGQLIRHQYNPGALNFKVQETNNSLDTVLGNNKIISLESSLYCEDDMRFGNLGINAGVHISTFNVQKKIFPSIQPRISGRYLLPYDYTVKASFATMTQFINLLSNEGVGLPTDLWVPSTARIKPQESWQAAMGIVKIFHEEYEASFEMFYKKMNNVISYKEGSSYLNPNGNWEDKITQGKGDAYGSEFFIQKKKGRFNGWVGYTLSWNYRQFDEINNGKKYRFKYDRRHDFELVANYQLSKKWSVSGSWQFSTGAALTLPIIKYFDPTNQGGWFDNYIININGSKNAYTLPSYHRMDLSFEYKKKHKTWESAWNFGAFNAYNRANPFFIISLSEYVSVLNKQVTKFKKISILPIIPNVSYSFKF